jgi:SnoaL-like polyketide cyclase
MSKEDDNKAIVGRWFTDFWGKTCNLEIVDELAAPDMLLRYSLHEPRRGREDIKAFMTAFREAFPDLNFWGAADLIAEGDYVVGRWEGGGTHAGPAFSDFLIGSVNPDARQSFEATESTAASWPNPEVQDPSGHRWPRSRLNLRNRPEEVGHLDERSMTAFALTRAPRASERLASKHHRAAHRPWPLSPGRQIVL